MKNLIAQNQESLQDVNKPVLPFGARPKVGAEFYIGNKELFGKNWQKFWINTEWKRYKPRSLRKQYKDYGPANDEGCPAPIGNYSFKFTSAILADRKWISQIDASETPARPFVRPLFRRRFKAQNLCKQAHMKSRLTIGISKNLLSRAPSMNQRSLERYQSGLRLAVN